MYENIFSNFAGCFSVCWLFPLMCRIFLLWFTPTYQFLFLLTVLLVSYPKKSLSRQVLCSFLLFSSRSFIVQGITLINCESVFEYVAGRVQFHFWIWYTVFLTPITDKPLIFSLHIHGKISLPYLCEFISGPSILFLWSMCLFWC
jgi:hypothetical protein